MSIIDENPITLERVRAALVDDHSLEVVHQGWPSIRGVVVGWSGLETDRCEVRVNIAGVADPISVERRFLLEDMEL